MGRAALAGQWRMQYYFIGLRCRVKVGAGMTGLTAGLFAGWYPQAFWGGLFKPVGGRGLGTVPGIHSQLLCKFLYGPCQFVYSPVQALDSLIQPLIGSAQLVDDTVQAVDGLRLLLNLLQ
jgi:hypothetical protein